METVQQGLQSQLKRNSSMEEAAFRRIIDLFTTQWTRTSQQSPNEVMAQVLGIIIAACVTENKTTTPTAESLQLLHANQYLESIRKKLKNGDPVPFPLVGNTLPDTISNLRTIRRAASNDSYAKDIQSRLDLFIQKLSEIQDKLGKKNILILVISVVIGFFITWLACEGLVSNNPSVSNWGLAVLSFVLFSGCAYVVIRRFF